MVKNGKSSDTGYCTGNLTGVAIYNPLRKLSRRIFQERVQVRYSAGSGPPMIQFAGFPKGRSCFSINFLSPATTIVNPSLRMYRSVIDRTSSGVMAWTFFI